MGRNLHLSALCYLVHMCRTHRLLPYLDYYHEGLIWHLKEVEKWEGLPVQEDSDMALPDDSDDKTFLWNQTDGVPYFWKRAKFDMEWYVFSVKFYCFLCYWLVYMMIDSVYNTQRSVCFILWHKVLNQQNRHKCVWYVMTWRVGYVTRPY